MLKSVLQYFLHAIGYLVLLLILIFPIVNFKISLASAVFPSLDIIIIYYLTCYLKFREGKTLVTSVFIDQLNAMPLGCSTLAFMSGSIFLRIARRWFLIKEYASNIVVFCGYCLIVFIVKYLVFVSFSQYPSIFEITFQYLITIFSYPLFKMLFDRLLILFNFRS